jgi:hypothetical protein
VGRSEVKRLHSAGGLLAACAISMLLGGCSSGGSIDVGGGQEADPGTVDFPIAYVKRTIPLQGDDLRDQRGTVADADLFMRNRASPSSTEVDITGRITGDDLYDIKDVDVSQDGQRIVFAMRGPLAMNQDERDPPSWNIWEYEISSDTLRRVIPLDDTAEEGHDISPQYLPDGRIVFSSTRQRQSKAILRDEGKAGYEAQAIGMGGNESAFLLHVMNGDGSDIHQVTFNQSHDLWPSVLTNGRVMFTRWDAATGRGMHLYTSNPDGTDLQLLYGARSHDTGTPGPDGPTTIQFTRPREMQDGRILTLVRPFEDTDFGGDLVLVDARNFVENNQPLAINAGMAGPAQRRATPALVSLVEGPSVGGRFRSAFPLWDGSNRLLVSWSLCRLLDGAQTPAAIVPCTQDRLNAPDSNVRYTSAPPLYSAFIYDPADNTFRPLFQPEEGVMITDLVAAQPRAPQTTILDRTIAGDDFDPSMVSEGVGLLEIRNIYDFDGSLRNTNAGLTGVPAATSTAQLASRPAAERAARFLRIEKAVSMGDPQLEDGFQRLANQAFGASNFMREILGYVPIEPDGSVSVRVPSNVAFVFSVLDGRGRRLSQFPQHRAWLQLRPGEIRRCAGCHQPATGNAQDASHGRGSYTADWVPTDNTHPIADLNWGAASGEAFPGTLPQTAASAQDGDTMAQARARTSCIGGSICSQRLNVNVLFDDVWTDPDVGTPDESIAWTYGAPGLGTPAPVRTGCISNWNSACRVIINYVEHIQPLWSLDRGDNTCTNCHAPPSATGLMAPPAGQLDLSADPSPEEQLHLTSYRELFFNDGVQDFEGGTLVERTVDVVVGTDPDTGEPIIEARPVNATRSLIVGNARGSRFFACFEGSNTCGTGDPAPDAPRGTINHKDFLTDSELRLISEWVDIGAQYFNNPFANGIPTN